MYRFVAKQRFIKKLQALLQPSDHSVIAFVAVVHLFGFIVSPVFFKAKTFAKYILLGLYTFQRNRPRPQIVATLNIPRNK